MNIVAVDISKARLDTYFDSTGLHESFSNDKTGVETLIRTADKDAAFVFEATGGYENQLLLTLVEFELTAYRCCGKRVRRFASSQGKAKTDRIDAVMIAQFAKASQLQPFSLPDKDTLELRELNIRRIQAMSMMQQESNRLEHKHLKIIEKLIMKRVKDYTKEIALLDEMITECINQSPDLSEDMGILCSIPGIGKQVSLTVLSEIPEIGSLDKSTVAAIAGLAPFNRDSGTFTGRRRISYSRQRVKAVLYMAAMSALRCNPQIKAFYKKLRMKGKPGKLALIACMRKLVVMMNAMLANRTYWAVS